jgi:WS/DGAT/MGAT family acyltransferase
MPATRLSPLDAAFLNVESPTAHMHVGWAAVFAPPRRRFMRWRRAPTPAFDEVRDHIARRMCRAPRYRQKLALVPFGLHDPIWIDDPHFDINRHVVHSEATSLTDVVDACMSEPLPHDRPLWQVCVADRLDDGRMAVVGKAHHCMVDGLAAVELASLLLDPEPDPAPPEPDGWEPTPPPGGARKLAQAMLERALNGLRLARAPLDVATSAASPRRLLGLGRGAGRIARAAADSVRPAKPVSPLNEPISPGRHLGVIGRPLKDLLRIKEAFEVTINDVLLATAAGGMRRFLEERGEPPVKLKTMVPVSVRANGADGADGAGELGNQISFIFVDLPCDDPDPIRRLRNVHAEMSERKRSGKPQGANMLLRSITYAPRRVQHAVSQLVASPRIFNLTVSNIPGPREPLYMLGCELDEVYPVVPVADHHAVSIGMTTVRDGAFFGVYADRGSMPDADALAEGIDQEIDELIELSALRDSPSR